MDRLFRSNIRANSPRIAKIKRNKFLKTSKAITKDRLNASRQVTPSNDKKKTGELTRKTSRHAGLERPIRQPDRYRIMAFRHDRERSRPNDKDTSITAADSRGLGLATAKPSR